MLIEASNIIVLKLGSSTVVDGRGKFKKKWVTSLIKDILKKLSEFKKKIKSKYEIISVFSNKDLLKVKKLLIKNVN